MEQPDQSQQGVPDPLATEAETDVLSISEATQSSEIDVPQIPEQISQNRIRELTQKEKELADSKRSKLEPEEEARYVELSRKGNGALTREEATEWKQLADKDGFNRFFTEGSGLSPEEKHELLKLRYMEGTGPKSKKLSPEKADELASLVVRNEQVAKQGEFTPEEMLRFWELGKISNPTPEEAEERTAMWAAHMEKIQKAEAQWTAEDSRRMNELVAFKNLPFDEGEVKEYFDLCEKAKTETLTADEDAKIDHFQEVSRETYQRNYGEMEKRQAVGLITGSPELTDEDINLGYKIEDQDDIEDDGSLYMINRGQVDTEWKKIHQTDGMTPAEAYRSGLDVTQTVSSTPEQGNEANLAEESYLANKAGIDLIKTSKELAEIQRLNRSIQSGQETKLDLVVLCKKIALIKVPAIVRYQSNSEDKQVEMTKENDNFVFKINVSNNYFEISVSLDGRISHDEDDRTRKNLEQALIELSALETPTDKNASPDLQSQEGLQAAA